MTSLRGTSNPSGGTALFYTLKNKQYHKNGLWRLGVAFVDDN